MSESPDIVGTVKEYASSPGTLFKFWASAWGLMGALLIILAEVILESYSPLEGIDNTLLKIILFFVFVWIWPLSMSPLLYAWWTWIVGSVTGLFN